MGHWSLPMAALRAAYGTSRSIRAGMIWLDFATLGAPAPEPARVFVERMGVERLTDGRLRAAGSMSGILTGDEQAKATATATAASRAAV